MRIFLPRAVLELAIPLVDVMTGMSRYSALAWFDTWIAGVAYLRE